MSYKNYSYLKNLILEEIQAHRTTLEVSFQLGFKFNKYNRWLQNSKILKWSEFEFLCKTMGINLDEALNVIINPNTKFNTSDNLFCYLKELNNFETNQVVADYLKCHVSVVKRYTNNKTVPDVETILKLLDMKPNLLSLFIRQLFPKKIDTLSLNNWLKDEASKQFSTATLSKSDSSFKINEIIQQAGNDILKVLGSNEDVEKNVRDILVQTFSLIVTEESSYPKI